MVDLFKARGYRMTPQRQCIFRILQDNTSHPTAESIYRAARKQVETISLQTVYRTLNELASVGEVLPLELGTGMARFDPNTDQETHHHAVCSVCGKVRDVFAEYQGVALPDALRPDFDVVAVQVVFKGVCSACQEASRTLRAMTSRQEHKAKAKMEVVG